MTVGRTRFDPGLRGRRILVVDDGPDARELFALGSICGSAVQTVESARETLRAIVDPATRPHHAVVTALAMPSETGEWLAAEVRRLSSDRGAVPIAAMTVHARQYNVQRLLSSGFNPFVAKPVDPPLDVCRTVAELISPR
jgi:CheY-like chemotaxis protein